MAEIHEYFDEKDLPFVNDPKKREPRIYNEVYFAKGDIPPWEGALAVKKLITIEDDGQMSLEKSKNTCKREAKVMFAARHDHIINVITAYFYSPAPGSVNFYIIMDRADGQDLSRHLNPKSLKERWIGCLIRTVAHIHRLGIRHRDIKPQNVLVQDGEVRLADFGISHMSLGKTVPTTNKKWNKSRTPAYCAPEVDEGQGRSRGRSADIFSLGAVILEMFLSHSYFKPQYGDLKTKTTTNKATGDRSYAHTLDEVHRILDQLISQREKEADWHYQLLALCRRMLNKDRDQRPSADDIETDWLEKVLPLAKEAGRLVECGTCTNSTVVDDKKNVNALLVEACRRNQEGKIDHLLSQGADPNTPGAIHQAALAGKRAIVQTLLENPHQRAQVDCQDWGDQTALHYAAMNGHKEVTEVLLKADADVWKVDAEQRIPLHYAASNGCTAVMEMIIDKGKGNSGESGGLVNEVDNDGLTPLHFAARQGHLAAVRLLLQRGADKTIGDDHFDHQTALEYAKAKGHKAVVKELTKWNPTAAAANNQRGVLRSLELLIRVISGRT
ncbi:Ankyrin repeat-containing domain protein [Naviculisporaceae sp. PSN 640]